MSISKNMSNYAKRMLRLRYPPLHSMAFLCERMREHGLMRDEHRDFVEDMLRLRAIRGKARPQKGQGRRAQHRNA